MATVLVLGGSGQMGRPIARRLVADGYDVTVAARSVSPPDMDDLHYVTCDRDAPGELAALVGDGFDVLVDIVTMTPAHAQQIVDLGDRFGSVITTSTGAVYRDDAGNSLISARTTGIFPDFPLPITESQPLVEPDDETYSGRKVAIEQILAAGPAPATFLRVAAYHGTHTRHAREWFFAQRVRDGRKVVILANGGDTIFNTTSPENLAEMVACAANNPGRGAFNCADTDPPTAREIGRIVAGHLGYAFTEVLLAGEAVGPVGASPWNVPRPFVLDTTKAQRELGYTPQTTYAASVPTTVDWLMHALEGKTWREVLTGSPYLETMFDYDAEDAFLTGLA
ncbi:MAG: NAD-dependent epimerase/dehydratase family protein [Actinobacteria bacterium]|uniref:Unannotated protein n=1 Tax=freshwater metagenome TaxID=449393 RepID=A0A6J6N7U5_9ZZZZ|nr:NAD-dependent epimerase/dehydratase family protein [Actinomycetota bacterium]